RKKGRGGNPLRGPREPALETRIRSSGTADRADVRSIGPPLRAGQGVELVVGGLDVAAAALLAATGGHELLQVVLSLVLVVVVVVGVVPIGVGHAGVVERVEQLGIEVDGGLELLHALLVLL